MSCFSAACGSGEAWGCGESHTMRVMEKMTKNHDMLVPHLTKGPHEMSGYFNTGHLASETKTKPKKQPTQEMESYEEVLTGLVAVCL